MIQNLIDLLNTIVSFQTDQLLTVLLGGVALFSLLQYENIFGVLEYGKTFFRIGCILFIGIIGLTVGVHFLRLPRGLIASYYKNPFWAGEPIRFKRLFDWGKQNVDRVIDLKPHHFKFLVRKPLSVIWQGYVDISEEYSVDVLSNLGTWLSVDDALIDGPYRIDFGTSAARTYIREGWSRDEQWGDPDLTFIWSSGNHSEFYLGVDELVDYTLSIRCIPFIYENSPPQKLTISINGKALDAIILAPEWKTYTIVVPRSALQDIVPGFFRIKFTYSHVVRPSDVLKESKEQRRLAVAFDFAVMQKVAQAADSSEVMPEFPKSPYFSPGVHHITLKAFQDKGTNPYIQLVWQSKTSGKQEIIPEDFLFPETSSPDRIRQRVIIERVVLSGVIVAKVLLIVVLGSLFAILLIRKIATLVCQKPKKLFVTALVILIGIFFIHLRYVCEQPQKLRTFLFFSYCFFLFTPCLYLVLRTVFSEFFRTLFFIFYLFLALFPYKVFFPATADLCTIFADPSQKLVLGLDRYWVLIIYGILSLIITVCWLWYRNKKWIWPSKKEILLCGFMLIVVALQIIPRLDANSPRMVVQGLYDHRDRCGTRNSIEFFGYCVMSDAYHHTYPNGMFKGVDDKTNYTRVSIKDGVNHGLYTNRRGLNAYLYSLIEPFIHPYYAAILMNGAFFYCLLLAGYTFAKNFNLPTTIVRIYPLLLSATFLYLYETIDTSFYIQKHFFSILILVAGYKLRIYSKAISLSDRFLFCLVLACSSLVYDPFINVGFVFFWGLFHAITHLKSARSRSWLIMSRAIVYAAIPIVSQSGFEKLLRYYHLEGDLTNVLVRNDVFSKLSSVPDFIVFNFRETLVRVNHKLIQVLFINPVRTEYLYVLGAFGVICFFALLPRYLKGHDLKGVYAMYSAGVLIPAFGSFVAYLPPEGVHAYAYTLFERASNHHALLVLAQCIGIYHIATLLSHWLPGWIKPKHIAYGVVLIIIVLSYYIKPADIELLYSAFE